MKARHSCRGLPASAFIGVLACLGVALGSIMVTSLPGCGCAGIGCVTGASLGIHVPDDVSIPFGSTVTACFNDTCAVGMLPSVAQVLPGSGSGITFPAGSNVWGVLWTPGTPGRERVEIGWAFPDGTRLQVGDRYRATLVDPEGVTIATNEATAIAYDEIKTCGDSCYSARFP